MSDTYLLIHAAWSTNNQKPQLNVNIRPEVFLHIAENAKKRAIEILDINGSADHLHVIIRLHPTQNLALVIHDIKGESANWINGKRLTNEYFGWQEGYVAVSISPSNKMVVKKYFVNHEAKHEKITFLEEVRFLRKDRISYS